MNENDNGKNLNIYIQKLKDDSIRLPRNFWNKETIKYIGTYVFNDILKWNKEEVVNNINRKIILSYGMNTPLVNIFNGNIDKMINYIIDGDFKRWEYLKLPELKLDYWADKCKRDDALKWLSKKYHKNKKALSINDFYNNGLVSLYKYLEHNTYKNEVNDAIYMYEKMLNGEITRLSIKYWTNETIKLVGEHILFNIVGYKSNEDVIRHIDLAVLKKYKIYNMMHSKFKGELATFVNFILNTKYLPWEFKSVPKNFWNDEKNRIAAGEWLGKKLNKNKADLTVKDYIDFGIKGALAKEHKNTNLNIIKVVNINNKKNIPLSNKWVKKINKNDINYVKVYDIDKTINIVEWNDKIPVEIIDKVKISATLNIPDIKESELNYIEYVIIKEFNKGYGNIKIVLRNSFYNISIKYKEIRRI